MQRCKLHAELTQHQPATIPIFDTPRWQCLEQQSTSYSRGEHWTTPARWLDRKPWLLSWGAAPRGQGNLSAFVEKKPEARAYYDLQESAIKFVLPEPGFLEGIKSKDRAILKMHKVGFR